MIPKRSEVFDHFRH